MEAVIARLKEYSYLDDQAFAETYARLRQENRKARRAPCAQDLRQKGVRDDRQPMKLSMPATADTNEEALARQHLERKRIRKPDEREGNGACDASAGRSGILDRRDLQDLAPVGRAGRSRSPRSTTWTSKPRME